MLIEDYNLYIENALKGRYIVNEDILPLIDKVNFDSILMGYSVLNKPIYKIKLGSGNIRILIWSQMHGNESTGTKAIFDLLNFFSIDINKQLKDVILKQCTLTIIPMLNPDGAMFYTRENAQKIDLNRDAVALKAPESKLLNDVLNDFKPNYCFNLHDQRSFFSVGKDNLPATLSFLAPSEDEHRTITKGRKKTMEVIVAMNDKLQKYIPNQIGRYTDEFYPTATGDNFQKAGFNTILIEAGHFINDYQREQTRKYNFLALIEGLKAIISNNQVDYRDYFTIPENEKKYFEILLSNVIYIDKKVKIGIFFKDTLSNKNIIFIYDYIILDKNENYNAFTQISKKLIFNNKEELVFYIKNYLKIKLKNI